MARETWLMQENGLYEPGVPNDHARTGTLDFGNPEAREWVFEKLTQLIAESGRRSHQVGQQRVGEQHATVGRRRSQRWQLPPCHRPLSGARGVKERFPGS